jgi:hypothetical protein
MLAAAAAAIPAGQTLVIAAQPAADAAGAAASQLSEPLTAARQQSSQSCRAAELSELPGSRALRAAGQQEMHPLWQAEAHPQAAAVMLVSCSNLGAAGVVWQFAVSTQLGKCSRSGPSQAGYGASTYERL